jgi:predicted DNA-binding WGR domain protein
LAIHVQGNPDYLLTLPHTPRIALDQATPSGGKFWVGEARDTGFSMRWGRVGTKGTVHHIPRSNCQRGNPVRELKRRALEKLRKGYEIIPQQTQLP